MLRGTLFLAFALSFLLYASTLAPTVTFEDSGELIAAAHGLGVPHSPGYPLYTLLGHVFTYVPLGNVAYRLNLMSALLSALGAAVVSWIVFLQLRDRGRATRADLLTCAAALGAGLWFATARETWEQSIIAEVYSLNALLFAVFLLLITLWENRSRERLERRYFQGVCFLIGLALTNHVTAAILLPALALYLLLRRKWTLLRPRRLAGGVLSFLLGLVPYAYLPLASRREPAMDWGNPDTIAGFVRNIFDYPYDTDRIRTLQNSIDLLATYAEQMLAQWFPLLLLLVLVTLVGLFRTRRDSFWFVVGFLVLTGPLTALATNFDISGKTEEVVHATAAVSVYLIPSYLMLALLMGAGAYGLVRGLPRRWRKVAAVVLVAMPLAFAVPIYSDVDMGDYYYAEDYAENLFRIAEPDSIVWAGWDPFYFPLLYYQIVDGRRTDLLLLDQHLLKRSWYVRQLIERSPQRIEPARSEMQAFITTVSPFEEGRPYDGWEIQLAYERMVNALVDRTHETGTNHYFTYMPPERIASGYFQESLLVAWRSARSRYSLTELDMDTLRYRGFTEGRSHDDRWVDFFATHYGLLHCDRATHLESLGDNERAEALFRRALEFLDEDHELAELAKSSLGRLEEKAPAP